MDKKKLTKKDYWKIAGLILLIVIVYDLISSENTQDYEYCIEDCVYEAEECMYGYTKFVKGLGYGYIEDFYVRDCLLELEICIDDCKQ